MDMDSTIDDIPVRDPGAGADGLPRKDSANRQAQQRRAVSKIGREELEDKYLRLHDENLILKKHARKQEEKIKKMATKLLRLVNDRKRHDQEGGVRKVRDVETEEMMEELQGKVRELEKQNDALRNKLMVAKQQLVTQSKRPSNYPHVQSRIDTGIARPAPPDHIKRGLRVQGGSRSGTPRALRNDVLPRYGHSLLEEARAENQRLEEVIQDLQEQIAVHEQDKEILREQMRTRQLEHEEAQMILKEQMSVGQRTSAKSNIQENVEMIRLQREVKEKSTKLTALKAQYATLEENLKAVKLSHDAVLGEMENINKKLQAEQSKCLSLQTELKTTSSSARTIMELQERIADVEREKEILNEANEKLLNSAFDAERERQYRANEKQLKLQIAQLEATLKGDLNDKNTLLDKLNEEREQYEKLQKESRENQINYFQVRQQYEELQEKMKFFTKESAVDFQELEEALIIVKKKKERGTQELEFLEKVDDEMNRDLKQQVITLQAEHAETASELEKTRNMLILQHKINRDYQMEVESATQRLEDYKQEYEHKLDESAQLLDMRAARIKKLERQLRDIAYGTKQYKVTEIDDQEEEYEEVDESIHLERGENLLEIHVHKINYTKEGLKVLGDDDPSTFVTYEFFEFELQSTPVVKGAKPVFDFTSQYKVRVDDFFLHHLMKGSTTLEMHQAVGTDYHTMAACQLRFRDLLSKPHGRVHGTAQLVGIQPSHTGISVGTVEFWVRLRVPMERALRLFRERVKAMGYMTSNQRATQDAISTLDQEKADQSRRENRDENINEITIKIIRCSDLKARRQGVQPNPYGVYRFFDNNDHDTTIITSSNAPEFNDSRTYPVQTDADLDRYLRTESLEVYVFDDADPEDAAYIGVAKVPLISLAHNKPIRGTFELKQGTGRTTGTIDVLLKWHYTYIAPKITSEKSTADAASTKKPRVSIASTKPALVSKPVSVSPMKPTPPAVSLVDSPIATSTPAGVRAESKRDNLSDGVGHGDESMVVKPQPPLEPRKSAIKSQPTIAVTPPPPDAEPRLVNDDIGEEKPPVAGEQPDTTPFDSEEEEELEPVKQTRAALPEASEDDVDKMLEEELMRGKETKDEELGEEGDDDDGDEDEDVVAQELNHQFGNETQNGNTEKYDDTMFGDEPQAAQEDEDSSIGEEVDIPVATEEGQETGDEVKTDDEMSADSDAVVMTPALHRPQSAQANDQVVMVTISHLSLEPDTPVMDNDMIQRLYVEYRFLGIAPEELETPFSLPKPKPYHHLVYNFRKVFHIDAENNKLRRDYLASMLLPQDPSEGKIRFTVVSEPPEDQQDLECEDVGYAYVDIQEMLKEGNDILEQDIDIFDVNDESLMVGTMNVTVECVAALKAVEQELEEYDQE